MKKNILRTITKTSIYVSILIGCSSCNENPAKGIAIINEDEFRDKVYACWLGKNIGGTLGAPFESKRELNNLTFYSNIEEIEKGGATANDDLDLQLLWLKAMEENNCRVDAYKLSAYWLKYVPVDWDEYGVCKANMRLGIMPPLSGEYNNARWKNGNGAWIRSEIWACLAPGNPMLAAQFAWNDASVDHGCAEGTFAEVFTASLESAAFIEKDRDKLIALALSMIPEECRVASAVNTVIEAKKSGKTWMEARETAIRNTEDTGWFQAPRNIAFLIIGLVYGEGDFAKSLCLAVNCGDDTDCTGATLGSVLGILYGTIIIPENWKKPIGEGIKTIAISGFEPPADIQVLTDRTIALQKKVANLYRTGLKVTSGKTNISNAQALLNIDTTALSVIWKRSPYQISRASDDMTFTYTYSELPEILSGKPGLLNFTINIENKTSIEKIITFSFVNIPAGYNIKDLPKSVKVKPQNEISFPIIIEASLSASSAVLVAEINDGDNISDMKIGIVKLIASEPYIAERNNLNYNYFEGDYAGLPDFSKLKPIATGSVRLADFYKIKQRADHWGISLYGYIEWPENEYTFFLSANNDSKLFIDDKPVIESYYENKGTQTKSGSVKLNEGKHKIRIDYLDLMMPNEKLYLDFSTATSTRRKIADCEFLSK